MTDADAGILRARHDARVRALGVADGQLGFFPLERTTAPTLRVLQWNLLADGLSNDGFLLSDVLSAVTGEVPAETASIAQELLELRKSKGDFNEAKERLSSTRAMKNSVAIVDWERRWLKMCEAIAQLKPDVITVQELDHMAQAQRDLGVLGYTCGPSSYSPLCVPGSGVQATDAKGVLAALRASGVAFMPGLGSTSRKLAIEAGVADADDDGCAIFWRAESLKLVQPGIEYLRVAKGEVEGVKGAEAVRVRLERISDGAQVTVMTTHLKSGDTADDEATRLAQISKGGLSAWFAEATSAGATILCLDANSSPQRTDEHATVWRELRGLPGVGSVWDAYFGAADGEPCHPSGLVPLTTNKMRGPLTGQAKKLGQHAKGLIDHIYYSSGSLTLQWHAWGPIAYGSETEALRNLLPSLACPSDHLPVCCDFTLAVQQPIGIGRSLRVLARRASSALTAALLTPRAPPVTLAAALALFLAMRYRPA